MIYLFYGTDGDLARAAARACFAREMKASGSLTSFEFDVDNFSVEKMKELAESVSLFGDKYVVYLSKIFGNKEKGDFVLDNLDLLAESRNVFVFSEGSLLKPVVTAIKKSAEGTEEFVVPAEEKAKKSKDGDFNIFAFPDALGARDRKAAWTVFTRALRHGIAAEELFWKAVWVYKNILLVKLSNESVNDLAVKFKASPFPLNKAKQFGANYSDEEARSIYKTLLEMYHDARRGVSLDVALEKFVLGI